MEMKRNKLMKIMIVSIAISLVFAMTAFATGGGGLESSPLVTGSKKLLGDGTTVLTGLVAAVTGFLAIKDVIQWAIADDEEKTKAKKRLQRDVSIGVLGTVIVGLIAIILNYYQ